MTAEAKTFEKAMGKTLQEKLRAMELLWESLRHGPDSIPVPAWHMEELQKTERLINAGLEPAMDLTEARERLRRKAKS